MKPASKAITPLLSYVLIIAITFTALAIVYIVGQSVIGRALEASTVNEALNNMNLLANTIRTVASGGLGSLQTVQLQVSNGRYRSDNSTSTLYFDYTLHSGAVAPGTFTKQGDVQIIAGGAGASATDNGTALILENEILKVILQKVGSPTSYATLDTKNNIQSIQNKRTSQTINPKNSSIIIGNDNTSSSGNGYSKLVISGTGLAEADATFLVNTTNYQYTILYSLPSLADYLTVQIQNTTNTNNTINFEYNISANGLNDTFRFGNTNDTNFTSIAVTGSSTASSTTYYNLFNTNYSTNSSSLTLNVGNGIVYYNASDGSWRNITELPNIGQGSTWNYSSNSTATVINYTLAGADGMDYGIRDSLAGGSYWIDSNGNVK